MAGSASDYLEKKLIDAVLGQTALPAIGTVYVALFTANPSDSGGGTEVTGGSYGRVAVTNNTTNWPNASGTNAAKSNGTAIVFTQATANWGTVTGYGLFDASSGGNLLFWADLTTSKSIQTGDTAQFAIGDLSFTVD